jgi:hypothetical protein
MENVEKGPGPHIFRSPRGSHSHQVDVGVTQEKALILLTIESPIGGIEELNLSLRVQVRKRVQTFCRSYEQVVALQRSVFHPAEQVRNATL